MNLLTTAAQVAHANALALALLAEGDSDLTSPDLERVTGRPPTSFATFATDYVELISAASV